MISKTLTAIDKYLIWILVSIIIIRLSLIALPSFHIDMNSWQAWSARLVEVTPIHFYAPNYFADYFPGYLYLLWLLGKMATLGGIPIFSLGFEFLLKLFTNIFDLATAYYIYKIVSKYQKNLGLLSAIFYLANPVLAFNSSVWGQVDGILTFFLVYSAYCLLELKKAYHFGISFALSILVKPQGLAIFPVMLPRLLANFKFSKLLNLLLIPALLIILSLPFFLKDSLLGLFHLFQKSASTYPYTSMFSYNFWSVAGWWVPDSNTVLSIPYKIWGVIIYFVSLVIILIPLFFRKNYKNNFLVYFASALAILTFFLFLTRIHQRYLFPFFAFLLIVSFIKNSMKLKIIYVLLSLIHFINLWYVYYYYNYVYPDPTFSPVAIFKFLSTNYNLFTLFNLIGFGYLILIYYGYGLSSKNHAKEIS